MRSVDLSIYYTWGPEPIECKFWKRLLKKGYNSKRRELLISTRTVEVSTVSISFYYEDFCKLKNTYSVPDLGPIVIDGSCHFRWYISHLLSLLFKYSP